MARTALPQEMGNLPAEVAAIIGREREVSEAKRLLAEARLLTLTGVGGVGKTRLALQIGRELERSIPQGVWLADLTSLRDGGMLARIVADAMGSRDRSARPSEETLVEYLRDRHALLILDNCEHLIHSCAMLATMILDQAPHVRIVATSRQRLGLDREVVMAVPPLDVPEEGGDGDVTRYDAVSLFVEQARMSDSAFALDEHNQAAVARLCRRLEGIPLAIELAAAWIRVLGPQEIYERLSDRYRFLNRGPRAMEPAHRSLLATMDWSFGHCDPREQLMWARLSVFPASFDADAALAVGEGGGMTAAEVMDAMAGLVDKSVLAGEAFGEQFRYSMLETIREYGAAKLVASGEQERVRRLHRDHYRGVSAAAVDGWFSAEQLAWVQRIGYEWPHIRAALEFCLTRDGSPATCLSMASELFEYWISYGAHSELRRWLDRALRQGPADAETAFGLAANAKTAMLQGDGTAARRLMDECVERARTCGDERLPGFVQSMIGLAAFLQGDLQQAVARLRGGLDWYARERPARLDPLERNNLFMTSLWLSMAAAFHREPDSADLARRCREMAEAAEAKALLAWGLYATGLDRLLAAEDARAASAVFLDSLRLQRGTDDRWFPAWAIEALAWACAAERLNLPRAAALMGIADAFRGTIGLAMAGFAPMARAHDLWAARLRKDLGERAFQDAFDRHAELDGGQAYAFVLNDDEPPASRQETPSAASVLTRRELQVAVLIAEGFSNKQIAARLEVAQRTAEGHVDHILTKLGFNSRTQVAAWYRAEVQGGDVRHTKGSGSP